MMEQNCWVDVSLLVGKVTPSRFKHFGSQIFLSLKIWMPRRIPTLVTAIVTFCFLVIVASVCVCVCVQIDREREK